MKKVFMNGLTAGLLVFTIIFSMVNCNNDDDDPDRTLVTITDMGNYFMVVLDFETGATHREMGEAYGEKLREIEDLDLEVGYDALIDKATSTEAKYYTYMARTQEIRKQIRQEYCDEIDGIASIMASADENIEGDGKLSRDEIYFLCLWSEVKSGTACNAVSVYGNRSETGNVMTARHNESVDWDEFLADVHAIIILKNGDKSLCIIGSLGHITSYTGFNDNGVFFGGVGSRTGAPYSATGKHSEYMELRYALENFDNVDDVGDYMADSAREYTTNKNIILSDTQVSKVLENNQSGSGENMQRALRTDSSELHDGVTWEYDDAICVVNSFVLKGNHDNHNGYQGNTARWQSFKTALDAHGEKVSLAELKEIASYDGGNGLPDTQGAGDIYTKLAYEIVIFEPATLHLEVFFRSHGDLPDNPTFETVPVEF